jgi:hypothetical protein
MHDHSILFTPDWRFTHTHMTYQWCGQNSVTMNFQVSTYGIVYYAYLLVQLYGIYSSKINSRDSFASTLHSPIQENKMIYRDQIYVSSPDLAYRSMCELIFFTDSLIDKPMYNLHVLLSPCHVASTYR